MRKILKREFFARTPQVVAKELLGKVLVRKRGEEKIYVMITETEAYAGEEDMASHARFGKTKRNAVMYGEAGVWYAYFVYGVHWMINIVTGREGKPSAVLIRGGRIIKKGKSDKAKGKSMELLRGPGVVTRELRIQGDFTGKKAEKRSDLWIEDWGIKVPFRKIIKAPRIGIAYAGAWMHKPWRFILSE